MKDTVRAALTLIADIAEGSTTANSLPHIAKIVRAVQKSMKDTKQQAHYRAHPKGAQRCDLCSMYVHARECTVVQGDISPAGWCKHFERKDK